MNTQPIDLQEDFVKRAQFGKEWGRFSRMVDKLAERYQHQFINLAIIKLYAAEEQHCKVRQTNGAKG